VRSTGEQQERRWRSRQGGRARHCVRSTWPPPGPPRASSWIYGDARLLEHALTNLLLNACDASRERGEVELGASLKGGQLEIAVSDRGAGIDPNVRARIQPFFSTKAEGTGLGLAIASEVMRMHRGELRFEDRPGGGTNAVLRLPAEPMSDDALADEAQDAHPAG
jgi:signal transduction histidine kinase